MADMHNDPELLLKQRRWLDPIPPALQEAYRRQRVEEFERLVRLWAPLLPLCFMAFQAFTLLFYTGELHGHDLWLLVFSEGTAITLMLLGLGAAYHDRWLPHYDRWIPWLFGLITAAKVGSGFLLRSPVLAINQVYLTLLVLLIGSLGLQLSLRAVLRGVAWGALPFLAIPWVDDIRFGLLFLGHYALTSCVALFVAAIREDKDRMMFLQSMLYQRERQEVQRLNTELAELARKDALTGLANRRVFDEALHAEWDRARRDRSSLGLLMIDVDHFKRYNDHYGHPAGDQCLARIAASIGGVVGRPGDVAARYGGEEFVILLPATELAGACELGRRLVDHIDALGMPHAASPTAGHVTVSVGAAVCVPHGTMTPATLTEGADAALYAAKEAGRHMVLGSVVSGV